MDTTHLKEFDLHFPGIWIDDKDRDWAFHVRHVLSLVEDLFVEAVTSYALFQPITAENFTDFSEKQKSRYEACLNGLYAKAFVFSLHGIERLLRRLCDEKMHPPIGVQKLTPDVNSGHETFFMLQSALHRIAAHRQPGIDTPAVLAVFADCRIPRCTR